MTRRSDAGLTILELLVVLGILSLITGLAAAQMVPRGERIETAYQRLEVLVDAARLTAIQSGRAQVLFLVGEQATAGVGAVAGDDSATVTLLTGTRSPTSGRIVIYPDGSASGPTIAADEKGRRQALSRVDAETLSGLRIVR